MEIKRACAPISTIFTLIYDFAFAYKLYVMRQILKSEFEIDQIVPVLYDFPKGGRDHAQCPMYIFVSSKIGLYISSGLGDMSIH